MHLGFRKLPFGFVEMPRRRLPVCIMRSHFRPYCPMTRSTPLVASSISSASRSANSATPSRSASHPSTRAGQSSLSRRPVPGAGNATSLRNLRRLDGGRALRNGEAGTLPVSVGPEVRSSPGASPCSGGEAGKVAGKVGRIAGQLEAKCLDMPGAADVIEALRGFVLAGTSPCAAVRRHFIGQAQISLRELQFNRFLQTALHLAAPDEDAKDLDDLVQRQWGDITARQPIKIIAHRGDGNTSSILKTMPIRELRDRVYVHEDENSLASTNKFLSEWSNPSSRLSGIECDVFLSADDVPFVTHSAKILAQLEQETCRDREPVMREGDDIRLCQAEDVPERYLKLHRWLGLVEAGLEKRIQAEDAARQRGEAVPQETPLRVELELKQQYLQKGSPDGWRSTNKVVSQFLKKAPQSHRLEVAMFCNSNVGLQVRNQFAARKTLLPHVVFGQGCLLENGKLVQGEHVPEAQELRFGLHMVGLPELIASGALDDKVVTFAPGLDHPSHNSDQQLAPTQVHPTEMDITIDQSVQSARLRRSMELIEERRARCGRGPLTIQVLTDHGEQGARTILDGGLAVARPKGGLAGALQGWNSDALRALQAHGKQPLMDDTILREVLIEAAEAEDPALIGRLLLERSPEQL